MVLLAIFDCVDDTKLVKQAVLSVSHVTCTKSNVVNLDKHGQMLICVLFSGAAGLPE